MFDFDNPPERRGTQCVKWDGIAEDLFPMWVADMDFPAPQAVRAALRARVEHGVFGYGLTDGLAGTICAWMREEFGAACAGGNLDESWIVLLPAVVHTLRAVSHLRSGPVLINTPNYDSLLSAPLLAGKPTILSPLKNSNEYYEMDFADMRARLTGETRLFFLCNPHNPVGRVYKIEELRELSRFARENNLIVISDEVHSGLVFDRAHVPYFSVDDYAREHSVTLAGPAKTFNLPGLPFGFAVIPNKDLREEFKKTCYALPDPAVFSVIAARAAYAESGDWKKAMVEYLRGNRDYLEGRLRAAFPAARLTHAEGTYLQWVDFRPLGIERPYEWLREHAKVRAGDGKIYGADGYVRLNFGTTRERLKDALDRVEERVRQVTG